MPPRWCQKVSLRISLYTLLSITITVHWMVGNQCQNKQLSSSSQNLTSECQWVSENQFCLRRKKLFLVHNFDRHNQNTGPYLLCSFILIQYPVCHSHQTIMFVAHSSDPCFILQLRPHGISQSKSTWTTASGDIKDNMNNMNISRCDTDDIDNSVYSWLILILCSCAARD